MTHAPEIVVGVDGSSYALAAVDLAAQEARMRGWRLRLVRAITWPIAAGPLTPHTYQASVRAEWESADRDIEAARARIAETGAALDVLATVEIDGASELLLATGKRAGMIAVGAHGHSDLLGVLAGSTAVEVATHASVPVLVARGHAAPTGDIAVGVDTAPSTVAAIEFAFAEATLRGIGVEAVHTWWHPVSTGPGGLIPAAVSAHQQAESDSVSDLIASWTEKFPDVPVRQKVVRGHAKGMLVEASRRAQLVVVGARGLGELTGALLGSVGQSLIHRSMCPVAIVRAPSG